MFQKRFPQVSFASNLSHPPNFLGVHSHVSVTTLRHLLTSHTFLAAVHFLFGWLQFSFLAKSFSSTRIPITLPVSSLHPVETIFPATHYPSRGGAARSSLQTIIITVSRSDDDVTTRWWRDNHRDGPGEHPSFRIKIEAQHTFTDGVWDTKNKQQQRKIDEVYRKTMMKISSFFFFRVGIMQSTFGRRR